MKDYRYGPYDKLIEQEVAKMSFDYEFKPFVIDALKRRAFQFDFSEEQVRTDLERLPNSLHKITSNTKHSLTADGIFYSLRQTINLSSIGAGLHTNKGLYATFVHELYHALASVNGYDQMAGVNAVNGEETFSLVEALVEGSSYSTVYPTKTKDPYYNDKVSSYNSIVFAPEMICATFGVNKQELFAHGIQNRNELDEFLSSKSGIPKDEITVFMDEFETNLDNMHQALYGGDSKKRRPWVRGKICEDSLKRLNYKCFNMMERIFVSTKEQDLTPEKFEDFKFNYNKLLVATKRGCKIINANPLNARFSTKAVLEEFDKNAKYYKNGIIQTEYYSEFKKTHEIPPRIAEAAYLVRYGTFNRAGHDSLYGILFQKAKERIGLDMPETDNMREMFNVSEETIRRNNPPEEKLEEWDNEFLKHNNLRKAARRVRFNDRINGLKRLVGIKPKLLLPEDKSKYEYTTEDLNRDSEKPIDELIVKPEDLRPFGENKPERREDEIDDIIILDDEEEK